MTDPIHKDPHTKYWANKPEVVAHRREIVARLRIRGLSMREIVAALSRPGDSQLLNPNSGEPFTLDTVKADCHSLDKEWRARTAREIDEHKAHVFITLQEVKRRGWQDGDMNVVLRALKQEAELLGLDAPRVLRLDGLRDRARAIADELGVPFEDVWAGAAEAFELAGGADL